LDVREKKSEHLITENAGNGEVAGEKTTVTKRGKNIPSAPLPTPPRIHF